VAFKIPSLDELSALARAAFRSEMPGADADIWPNVLTVVAKVLAQITFGLFKRLEWIYAQTFVSTATGAHLDRHAYEHGLQRKGGGQASGYLTCAGVPGKSVPAGRAFWRVADGRVYVTTAAVEIPSSGSVLLPVASVDADFRVNAAGGATLARQGAYPELTSDGTIAPDGLTGGALPEGDEELRARILDMLRNPPMGGALHDYRHWAMAVTGVRAAFAARNSGDGSRIYLAVLGQGRGAVALPDATLLAAVATRIEQERPLAAKVSVTAPVPHVINIAISSLDPASTAVQDEIRRELDDLFYERAGVLLPADVPSFPRAWLESAIDNAAGETRHVLVSPAADVALTLGDYPILGAVTFS